MMTQFKMLLAAVLVYIAVVGRAQVSNEPVLHMIGDSTMCNYAMIPPNPLRGWGQMLPMYFGSGLRVENHAASGRSTKSFRDEKRWAPILESLRTGDFVIIQFGHNDEKYTDAAKYPDPLGQFRSNLVAYVHETRAKNAMPVLATPIARRTFEIDGSFRNSHGEYPGIVRAVAAELKVPLLDLTAATEAELKKMGPERAMCWFNQIPPGEFSDRPRGVKDDTHLTAYGASRVCDLAVAELEKSVPELAAFLKRQPLK